MSEISGRLQNARIQAGFKTASDAARFHGWNENTYRSHENGERGLKGKVAAKYARALKVSYSWLLVGDGISDQTSEIYLTGLIRAGGLVSFELDNEHKKTVFSTPVHVPVDTKCYFVDTDAFNPRYGCGDLIYTFFSELRDSDDRPLEGILKTASAAYLGTLVEGRETGFRLEILGARSLYDLEIVSFEPVEMTVRRGRYLKDRNFPSSAESDIDE